MNLGALTIWYEKRAPREQRILRVGAIAVVIILLLWLVLPLHRNLTQAGEHLRQQQEDLEWMREVGPTLAAAGPGQAAMAPTNESLVATVDRTVRESGLDKASTGGTLTGDGALRQDFENADFNLLVGWLHRLNTQQGVLIPEATITGTSGAGLVNASVLLRPGKSSDKK